MQLSFAIMHSPVTFAGNIQSDTGFTKICPQTYQLVLKLSFHRVTFISILHIEMAISKQKQKNIRSKSMH